MRHFKRALDDIFSSWYFVLVLAMLGSMAIVVSAEETTVIESEVQNSITIAEDAHDNSGKGLAFRIQMNIKVPRRMPTISSSTPMLPPPWTVWSTRWLRWALLWPTRLPTSPTWII